MSLNNIYNYETNNKWKFFNNELESKGFIILKNVYSNNELELIKKSLNVKTKQVNYPYLKNKIENIIYPKLTQYLNWNNPLSVKWRFSNNNNSTDAGFFHRDIKYYNFDNKIPNIYTVLTYMDGGTIEIIPGTHKKDKLSVVETFEKWSDSIKIDMKPGELLIIHSNVLHRGVFHTHKQKNRRLLQMFNTYPSVESYRKYHKNFYNKPFESSRSILHNPSIMVQLQKFEIFNKVMGFFVYFFASIRSFFAHITQIPSDISFLTRKNSLFCTSPTPEKKKNIDNENMYYYNGYVRHID